MPLPERFDPGEFADVSGQLNRNFDYLFQLILNGGTGGSGGNAVGSSTAQAISRRNGSGAGASVGIATVLGTPAFQTTSSMVGTSLAVGIATAIGLNTSGSVGTAAGSSLVQGFDTASGTGGGTATGAATVAGVGSGNTNRVGAAAGVATVVGASNRLVAVTGSSQGLSSVLGVALNSGTTESADGATNVGPTNPINASSVPGTTSGNLNAFTLTASPGTVLFNGVADTDTDVASATMLFYNIHVLYVQNVNGNWFRWVSANNWVPSANPMPVAITESVEGMIVTTAATPIMYASSVPGSAAPNGASIANGQLVGWTMTANPGQVQRNNITDTNTGNVVQMYYHNHKVWHLNSGGSWYQWDITGPDNGYTFQAIGPVPTTPTLNIGQLATQTINQTWYVSGTYQAYPGTPATPQLQYADNFVTGSQTSSWSSTDKSASITITNAGLTASSTQNAISATVRSNTSFSTGKKIFEIGATTLTGNWSCGVANPSMALASGLGDNSFSFSVQPNWPSGSQFFAFNAVVVSTLPGNNSANGDKITFAVDFDTKRVWFTSAAMRAAGFPWNNALIAAQNPANGTGGFDFALMTGPYFIAFNEFDSGGVATVNTIGPYAVSIPSGFTSWDVGTASTWLSLPSNAGVTPTAFSFVHPPVATQNPSSNVAVRDVNNTGVVSVSNTFQIQAPGVVTLNPLTLSKNNVSANQPVGTLVGDVTCPTSGGTFTGTMAVTSTPVNQFTFAAGSGNVRQLVTNAVLGASAGIPIVITASMSQAIGSPQTLSTNIVVTAESGTATSVTTAGPTIVGSSTPGVAGTQLTWGLIAAAAPNNPFRITLNGVTQNITAQVAQIYYINHTFYQSFGASPATTWQFYNGTAIVGGQVTAANFTTCPSPIPVIQLNTTNFPAGTNGNTGITATLVSAGNTMTGVTWSEDSATFVFQSGTNILNTTGTTPAGTYGVNITATVA